jgi:hypothetical protein
LLSLKQIGSSLTSRINEPPHIQWSEQAQAAIVILWGLLIYPQLDRDINQKWNATGYIHLHKFIDLFQVYAEGESIEKILSLLEKNDYIRIDKGNCIKAGTHLLSAVHALRMYRFFRSSVLSRQLFHSLQKTSTL